MNRPFKKSLEKIKVLVVMVAAAAFVFMFSSSLIIALAFSLFVGLFLTLALRKNMNKRSIAVQEAAPELIDHLISGLQSGLSLNESLVGLSIRGPEALKPCFERFRINVYSSGDFVGALEQVKSELSEPTTDLIVESLLISKTLGGAELINILRLLGNFIREDLTLRREILVKQSWIKNSAHLSASAPWILLLLLSTQPSTAKAYATKTGILILLTGLLLTSLAYLWMNQLARLPQQSRVFAGEE
jgi:tight adherence protein B